MHFSRICSSIVSACLLAGVYSSADAHIGLNLGYVDTSSTAYSRFKNYVDDAVDGNRSGDFTAVDAAYMYVISGGQTQYCALAVEVAEEQVSNAESAISGGGTPAIARDSYLYVGGMLMDVSITYDWCGGQLSSSQKQRYSAYAEQTLYNVWNPEQATWGGRSYPWSGWSINDPGNNYHYSFLEATIYWSLASDSVTLWQPFLDDVKLPALENYFASMPGGGSQEGTGYGSSHRRLFGEYRAWKDSTGEDLGNANSHMTDSISFWAHATVPTMDRFAPIGDQARQSTPDLYDYYRHLVLEARYGTNDQNAKDIASWWLHSISVQQMANNFNFRYDLLPAGGSGHAPAELSYLSHGVGALFARTSWTSDATWMSFMAGPYTQSHAHQEQGSFTLFGGGDWLTVTENIWSHSGIEQDTIVHNVLRFENGGNAIRQDQPTQSEMQITQGDGGNVTAVADLTPAYGGDEHIQNWQRTIDFQGGLLTVSDDYAVSSDTQAIFQINTPVRPVVSGNTAIAGGLKITVVQPANATLTVIDWTDVDSDFEGGYRLDVSGGNGQYVVQLGHPDVMLANGFD
jgi:hypothetical protein